MNQWDERYQNDEYYYGTQANEFLRDKVHQIKPGGYVLSLAEGEGRNAVYLASRGLKVTAVDSSARGLEKLKALAQRKKVEVQTVLADITQYDFGRARWDGIVSIWCHLPPDQRTSLHQRVIAGLKPGGVYLLEAYRPEQLELKTGGPSDASLMVTVADLKKELAGLDLNIKEKLRFISEGKGHNGNSAVVQLVARKP